MGEGSTKACKYKSIVIPKSITDIEDNALKECTAEEVVLPDTITTMGNGQFSGSNNIKKIKLSESLKVLSKDFLSNSTSDCYPEVILPKKLKKIDDFCFYNVENTKNVESLEFPGGIEEIGAYAFNNYEDLKELKLPANLKKIGEMAFSGESSLENVTIPDNVEEIGQGAFSGCVKLTFTVPCERIKDLLLNCNSGINENNIEVKDLNAMHWNYYESGALTGSNAAGSYCYDRTTGLTYRKVDDNSVELTKVRDQYDYEEEYKDVVNVPATIEVDDKTYEVTSLSKGSIGKNCIYKKIVLPDTLVSIGDGILGKYNNIEIVLPDSLINMGNNQFCYSDIKEINLPKNLKEIGKYCFENCSSLVSINIPDSVEKIGACSFSFCPNLKEVKLPSSLKEIEDSMFSYSKGLEAIDIPDSVENIGYYAFQNCANLKEVKLPSNLKEIEGYAFYNDKNLEQIYIPDSVEKIGEHAFQGCSNVTITVGSERVKELLLDCHCFLNKDKIIVVQ